MLKQDNTIKGFLAGDREIFKLVYAETKDFLYRVIYRMVGSRQDTEDLLHDIYVKVFEKHYTYEQSQSSLKTWLYHISVNHTVNYLKIKKSFMNKLLQVVEVQETNKDNHSDELEKIDNDETVIIQSALNKVNEIYRLCIILKDIEDKSYKEIAAITGLSIGALKTRLNRGRKQFIKFYKREVDHI